MKTKYATLIISITSEIINNFFTDVEMDSEVRKWCKQYGFTCKKYYTKYSIEGKGKKTCIRFTLPESLVTLFLMNFNITLEEFTEKHAPTNYA
jgi:hypothetical protein